MKVSKNMYCSHSILMSLVNIVQNYKSMNTCYNMGVHNDFCKLEVNSDTIWHGVYILTPRGAIVWAIHRKLYAENGRKAYSSRTKIL